MWETLGTDNNYWRWIEVNVGIIPPSLLSLYIMASTWRIDDYRWPDKEWSENIFNWFITKSNSIYWSRIPRVREHINEEIKIFKSKFRNFRSDYSLSKLIEFAIEDLLDVLFFWSWIRVIKTSEYDDIKSWIDYIVIWKKTLLWIDLKLRWSMRERDGSRTTVIPIEYNIVNWKSCRISKQLWLIVEGDWIIEIRREKFVVEPNLAQLFLKNYLEIIRRNWYSNRNREKIVKMAWQQTILEYSRFNQIVRDNTNMSTDTVTQVIENTARDLFKTLTK